jgi:hypothetical protein
MKFPEDLRWKNAPRGYESREGDPFGMFRIPGRRACGRELGVIACDGVQTEWEHVSVSLVHQPKKCPSWLEMSAVKSLFWGPEEVVMQIHPAEKDYVNNHPGCLHLWRPVKSPISLPPALLVGLKQLNLPESKPKVPVLTVV